MNRQGKRLEPRRAALSSASAVVLVAVVLAGVVESRGGLASGGRWPSGAREVARGLDQSLIEAMRTLLAPAVRQACVAAAPGRVHAAERPVLTAALRAGAPRAQMPLALLDLPPPLRC